MGEWPALDEAIQDGESLEEITKIMGSEVSPSGWDISYSLLIAVQERRESIVRLLMERGAALDKVWSNWGGPGTALTTAAGGGEMDMVRLLLDWGADVNTVDNNYGTALATAAYCGNLDIVLQLLDQGANVNIVGDRYGTALATAAYAREMDIVRLLLDRDADANIVGCYGTALAAAASGGRKDIVSLLLDRGANVNTVGGKYGTALAAAAYEGKMDIVLLLLDRGANANIVGDKYGTALAAAASGGEMDIVRVLLDWGADVNTVGGEYGTALATAAYEGQLAIVLMLLVRGANVNTVGGEYGTALASVVARWDIDIVKLLLDWGADVNTVGGQYGTALATAASGRRMSNVRLLLSWGADVNTVGGEYGTALAAAAYWGNMDIVLLLLERGANVNTVGGKYGTGLTAAVYRGVMDIVRLLLDRGADVNMLGGKYGTALAVAASGGGMDIVSLLLGRGADVNTVGGKYGTALAAAAARGEMDIVRVLLSWGANINTVGGKYGTALAAAAARGEMGNVRLLLGRGADVNTVGGKYGTALAAAASGGEMDVVRLLLDRGANVDTVGGEYGTALAAAAAQENTSAASLLLDRGADIYMLVDEDYIGTLFAAAAVRGVTCIILRLLERGVDVNMVCRKYGTALAAAASGGRTDIVLLLLEHGADIMPVGGNHVDPVDSAVSWPPFPMPYTGPYHHDGTRLSSLHPLTLSAEFQTGGSITPGQADVPCPKLTEEALWNALAALVGLEDTTLAKHQWIRYDLCYFVAHHFDFGLAYAAARVAWRHLNEQSMNSNVALTQRRRWHRHAQMLDQIQSKAIEVDSSQSSSGQAQQRQLIISPYSVMPRRLWDLKSNRVVDFRMLHAAQTNIETRPTFWAITHSWTSDMTPVSTPINQFQWPVPLPKGISLESLRSELLTFGAEYVWLDVICLRQKSKVELEQLRQQEWKLDVPTIGNIYRAAAKIVRYFNGLGVPFSNDGWDGPRHWLCRAWTLQEIASEKNTINGGILQDRSQRRVFLNSQGTVSKKSIKFRSAIRPVIQLAAQVGSLYGCDIYDLAQEMARRHSTEPVDKLSGLFYLLRTTKLPCYDEQLTSEEFWRQCFHLLPLERKSEILFDFPYRGSDDQWFPTWAQLLKWPTRDPEYDHIRSMRTQVSPDFGRDISGKIPCFISDIWTISNAVVCESDYQGEYEVKINERLFGFYLPYLLQKPIDMLDSPAFTLATPDIEHGQNWAVCKAIGKKDGKSVGLDGVAEVNVLKKIGVLRTDSCSELMVWGQNGASLLQKMDCLFV